MGAHFTETSFRFLRGLKRNNDRDWFNERKLIYEQSLKEPLLTLVDEINGAMLDFAPEHVRTPAKTMMRIYRDIRFSKEKQPYKTHVAAWWTRAGLEKISGGGFYLQISPAEVLLAAGVYLPEREQLLALRRHIVVHHARLRRELNGRRLITSGFTAMPGDPLLRPPKGFADHPEAMDLLLRREWGVSASLPVTMALKPNFGAELVRRLRLVAPLVALLNEPLVDRPKNRSFSPLLL